MPVYRNRPSKDPGTHMWRYLSLDAVIETVRDRKLRFTRVDKFPDPFEGSVPKQTIDDQVMLFGGAYHMLTSVAAWHPSGAMSLPEREDPWERMTRLRRAKTRSTHACCWAAGHESEALWRLFCKPPGKGVALRTTLAQLEKSVAPHDLYISPINYRPYYEGPTFDDDLDPFMNKRQGFSAENEVRLLKVDDAQFGALMSEPPPTTAELPAYLYLDWPAADTIVEIVLSPYAEESFEQAARAGIEAVDASLRGRVILSVLNPRRYAPGF
jgi:hypothetical protein